MLFEVAFTVMLWANGALGETIAVDTPLGQVRGHELLSRTGRSIAAFTSVPYAEPPLAGLRFKELRANSRKESKSETKAGVKPKSGTSLGSDTSVGTRSEKCGCDQNQERNGIEVGICRYEGIDYMSMLAELRALTLWELSELTATRLGRGQTIFYFDSSICPGFVQIGTVIISGIEVESGTGSRIENRDQKLGTVAGPELKAECQTNVKAHHSRYITYIRRGLSQSRSSKAPRRLGANILMDRMLSSLAVAFINSHQLRRAAQQPHVHLFNATNFHQLKMSPPPTNFRHRYK
ncbi:hypothetical protein EVAR_65457_1 [Eumeta japonica]|uniref:Carboxylesterase type B domain-containing protein n=1 Tax=Eumeta variegata TaxID=151549 RepID=A0A4C1YUS1_EUMVA|nr:hypothetical protein EVAR_65457_1 [Eumeta japonica]